MDYLLGLMFLHDSDFPAAGRLCINRRIAKSTFGGHEYIRQRSTIDLLMTLDKSTFTSAEAVYPGQEANIQSGKLQANIKNNDFVAYVIKRFK